MIYYAYELWSPENIDMGVDLDAAKLWERLRSDLQFVATIEKLVVGKVEADSITSALHEVRLQRWLTHDDVAYGGLGGQERVLVIPSDD